MNFYKSFLKENSMIGSLLRRQLIILIFLLPTLNMESIGLDVRIAAFFPTSKLFRDIYGTVSPSYQIEASGIVREHWHLWSNLSYVRKSGHSIPLNVPSRLQLVPIAAGFKYVWDRNGFAPYAGIGLSYIWLKEKNNLDLCNRVNSAGAIFKSGITKKYKRLAFSLFADYQLQKFTVTNSTCRQRVNISGFLLGGAIGVTF